MNTQSIIGEQLRILARYLLEADPHYFKAKERTAGGLDNLHSMGTHCSLHEPDVVGCQYPQKTCTNCSKYNGHEGTNFIGLLKFKGLRDRGPETNDPGSRVHGYPYWR